MDEQQTSTVTPNPLINSNPEVPGNAKNSNSKFIMVAVVAVVIVFVGIIYLLNKTSVNTSNHPVSVATDSSIKNTTDLDKAASDLDNTDLTGFDNDLQQNDLVSSTF